MRDILTVQDNIILKGTQVVVPPSLQREITAKVHHPHLGIINTKTRAKTAVWWSGINSDLEDCTEMQSMPRERNERGVLPVSR